MMLPNTFRINHAAASTRTAATSVLGAAPASVALKNPVDVVGQ